MDNNLSCGAQNISSFRNRLSGGSVPSKESITFEGLFNTHFFKHEKYKDKNTTEIVDLEFSVAQIVPPFANGRKDTNEIEKFVSVDFHTKDDGINKRDAMNLIIVLDISGSMGASFDNTYSFEGSNSKKETKMEIANKCVAELFKSLQQNDHVGIVLFDTRVQVLQGFKRVGDLSQTEVIQKIMEIKDRGGTNMEIGFKTALEMLNDAFEEDAELKKRNSRVLFMTDAMVNSGLGPNDLLGMVKNASSKNIFTTLIGIGLDFASNVAEVLTKSEGANYYSVKNKKEFQSILQEDFNYAISPLAKGVYLSINSDTYEIAKVYGTPFQEESGKVRIKIGSISGSPKDKELGLKGGPLLMLLKEKENVENPSHDIEFTINFETIKGKKEEVELKMQLNYQKEMAKLIKEKKNFQGEGIRKIWCLRNFVETIHCSIDKIQNRISTYNKEHKTSKNFDVNYPKVSEELKKELKELKKFIKSEASEMKDKALEKEVDIVDQFIYLK